MPHSTESEQSVLGAMLMDSEAIHSASEILTGEDFYNKQYGVIFDAMVELQNTGRPVDLVTLQDNSKRKGCSARGKLLNLRKRIYRYRAHKREC